MVHVQAPVFRYRAGPDRSDAAIVIVAAAVERKGVAGGEKEGCGQEPCSKLQLVLHCYSSNWPLGPTIPFAAPGVRETQPVRDQLDGRQTAFPPSCRPMRDAAVVRPGADSTGTACEYIPAVPDCTIQFMYMCVR
jgi:hypothetical protein